jgi:hypothetical protein
MNNESELKVFMRIAELIKSRFPHFQSQLTEEHPECAVMLDIPAQKGLSFKVHINLQGDELHLCAGSFWCEWFPCTDKDIAEQFTDAVCGLLAGDLRIMEYRRNGDAYKAKLQRRVSGRWRNIGVWSKLRLPIWWGLSKTILQNNQESDQVVIK